MQFINFWQREIALAAGALTAALDLPDGSYVLVLSDAVGASATRWEVVLASVAAGTATLQRGQENTADQAWPSGSLIYCALTAGQISQMYAALGALAPLAPLPTNPDKQYALRPGTGWVEVAGGGAGFFSRANFAGRVAEGVFAGRPVTAVALSGIGAAVVNNSSASIGSLYGLDWLTTAPVVGPLYVGDMVLYAPDGENGGIVRTADGLSLTTGDTSIGQAAAVIAAYPSLPMSEIDTASMSIPVKLGALPGAVEDFYVAVGLTPCANILFVVDRNLSASTWSVGWLPADAVEMVFEPTAVSLSTSAVVLDVSIAAGTLTARINGAVVKTLALSVLDQSSFQYGASVVIEKRAGSTPVHIALGVPEGITTLQA